MSERRERLTAPLTYLTALGSCYWILGNSESGFVVDEAELTALLGDSAESAMAGARVGKRVILRVTGLEVVE